MPVVYRAWRRKVAEAMAAVGVQNNEVAKFHGVVTPHHPRTDETSAIVFLERRRHEPVDEIKLWGHPECSWDTIDQFVAQGFLPIEIGETSYKEINNSRNKLIFGSAMEAAVSLLGFEKDDLDPGELKLMEILARRNGNGPKGKNEGGYMNKFHMSLPRILKDVYMFPGYDEADVITRFKDIVHAFLEYENRPEEAVIPPIRIWYDPSAVERVPIQILDVPDLDDLAKKTAKCQLAPFTPGRYLRDLCYRGEPADVIREKVEFWIKAWYHFQSEFIKARHDWPREEEKLRFSFDGFPGAALKTGNRFFPKVVFGDEQPGNVNLLISMGLTGHTAIIVKNKKNTFALYQELNRLEPGRWFRHEATQNLFNGGPEFPDMTPTSLSLGELAGLVEKFPPS